MMEKCHTMFSRVQQELESPPTANTWSYHGSNSPVQSLCHRPCEGIHCVGVETKARSQLESLCSFCPCWDQFLFTVGSEGWMPLNINCAMLQDVLKANMSLVPRQCSAGGHLGLHVSRAKEHSWGLGCFLETTELDENVPSAAILYLFFPLQFLSGISFPWTSFSKGGSERCPRSEPPSPFRCLQINFLCFHLQMFEHVHKWQRFWETVGELYHGF